MNRIVTIFISFFLASLDYAATKKNDPRIALRIYGGKKIDIKEAPYAVSIHYYDEYLCSGCIIDRFYILTAAHCVQGREETDLTVRSGSSRQDEGGTVHHVFDVIVNPDYNGKTVENDAAVLFLEEPITISDSAKVIGLATKTPSVGESVSITGWGSTRRRKGGSPILKTATVTVISNSLCRETYKNVGRVNDNVWCAAHPRGETDTCNGDSGGPAVAAGKVAGITSWGKKCGVKGQPGVYTDVYKLKKWIEEELKSYG